MIEYFFNGRQESLKLNDCIQVNDDLLRQISVLNRDESFNRKYFFKSLKIKRCQNITGKTFKKIRIWISNKENFYLKDDGLAELLREYSSELEDISLTNLNIPLNSSLNEAIRSSKLSIVDLSFCALINDASKINLFIFKIIKFAFTKG